MLNSSLFSKKKIEENTSCNPKFTDNEGKGKPPSNYFYSLQIKIVFTKESFAAKPTLTKVDDCRKDNMIMLISCLSGATCAMCGKHYRQGRW